MTGRTWVLAATAWVGVVIVGSALTWLAIDRAGQQVSGTAASSETTRPAVVGTIGSPPVASGTPSVVPSGTASVMPSAGGTASSAPATPTRTPTSTPTHPTKSSGGSPPKSSPPANTEIRTWSGPSGSVTVSCTGSTIRFQGASPNDGWRVERGDDSGDEIEVKFEEDETEVQVKATCVSGVPRFQVETSGDD